MIVSKKKILFVFLIGMVITSLSTLNAIREYSGIPYTYTNESSSYVFYYMQSSIGNSVMGIIYTFFSFIVVPLIYSYQVIKVRINRFDYLINVRMHKKEIKYIPKTIGTNFFITYIYFLANLVLSIVLISFLYGPFKFENPSFYLTESIHYYMNINGLVNFLLYIFLAPLGYALFSTLVYIIGLFLKKYVMYLPSGLVVGLLLTIFPAMIGSMFMIEKANLFPYVIELQSLISPGLASIGSVIPEFNALFAYLLSFLFYSFVVLVLYNIRTRLDKVSR